jgi:hypothetical protein
MIKKGVIGSGSDKFTSLGALRAFMRIREILDKPCILVSGHSIKEGIDIWSEDIFRELYPDITPEIKAPLQEKWDAPYGYKARNLDIAQTINELYVIVANHYPPLYTGERFKMCYHCGTANHLKSGACWTAKQARILNKPVFYTIIENE